ncbi:MAG: hypothetical protein R3E73_12825 [Porticoccaceae bacterium]
MNNNQFLFCAGVKGLNKRLDNNIIVLSEILVPVVVKVNLMIRELGGVVNIVLRRV